MRYSCFFKVIGSLLLFSLASFLPSFALTFTDASGETIRLQHKPGRIVSLAPAMTEELFLLGKEKELIGVTTYCIYPPEARKKEKIGTFLEPNIEKIILLVPDLVLASKEGHRKETITELRRLRLNVFVFDAVNTLQDICRQFLQLSQLVGEEQKARKILTEKMQKLRMIEGKVQNCPQPKVLLLYDLEPLITIGKNTFANELIQLAGGISITSQIRSRYPRYNWEEVIKQNPDIIILADMNNKPSEKLGNWKHCKDIKAIKEHKVFVIEADKISIPNLPAYFRGLETVAKIIHPEVFQENK